MTGEYENIAAPALLDRADCHCVSFIEIYPTRQARLITRRLDELTGLLSGGLACVRVFLFGPSGDVDTLLETALPGTGLAANSMHSCHRPADAGGWQRRESIGRQQL